MYKGPIKAHPDQDRWTRQKPGYVPPPEDRGKVEEAYNKAFGEKELNVWPRDKHGKLLGD